MNFFYEYHPGTRIIRNTIIRFKPHLHKEAEIITLLSGNARLTADGKLFDVHKGDFVVIFPNIVHSYETDDNVEVGKIIFDPSAIHGLEAIFDGKRPAMPVIRAEQLKESGVPELAEEIFYKYNNSNSVCKKAYLMLICGKLSEYLQTENIIGKNDTVSAVLEYCGKHYKENLTLDVLSKKLYISKSCLSHIFGQKLKINFRTYINMLRVNEAAALINGGKITMTDITQKCGFGSIRTFNRAFLEHTGVTPREYYRMCYAETAVKING